MTTLRKGVTEMNGESACPVCFKDVEIFSIGVCDHPICHECSTRMRVLCKEDACPICRQDLNKVAFIKEVKPYQQLNFNSYVVDKNTRIHFENAFIQEVYEKLLIHVCQLCPSKPSYASLQILKDHLRKEHELFFCDLCVEHLKIFSQERRAYTRQELALHRRKGDPDNTSHRGHPLCNFCDKRYVDADELFRHLRRDHYFCHFCDADGLNHYYCAYDDLREHFRDAHFLCEESECKEEKFTCVFRTEIDIRAHKAQVHSMSLGKAAVKQARTLELDFTLAPRSGLENKLRVGRRGAAKVPEKHDQSSNPNENHDFRVSSSCVNADIRNPEEFPSLTVSSQSVTKQNVPSTDSLAKKLAKTNRFTVKNVFGSQDEFPSLVTPKVLPTHLDNGKRLPIKSEEQRNRSPITTINSSLQDHSSIKEGVRQNMCRSTHHQNNVPQGEQDLRQENFPTLSLESVGNCEDNTSKAVWVKKDPAKSIKSLQLNQSIRDKKLLPAEEFPSLVSPYVEPTKKSYGGKPKDKNPNLQSSNQPRTVIERETLSKSNVKTLNINAVQSSKNKTGEKKSDFQSFEIGMNPNENSNVLTRKAKSLNVSCISSSSEPSNSIGSKVGIVKLAHSSTAADNNGARPKIKVQPVILAPSDFPALGSSATAHTSIFDNSHHFSKTKPTVNNIQSKNENIPFGSLNNNLSPRTYMQPPDFSLRNEQLIATVKDLLCNQQEKIEEFRKISIQFRNGARNPKDYYKTCLEIMGDDCFSALFPELLCLLPDISKQQQILKVHRFETKSKSGMASAEPFVVCATCGQVLAPSDLKHHLGNHSLEVHFPSLDAIIDGNVAWNKR